MTYKILWLSAVLVGLGNAILFYLEPNWISGLSALGCGITCGITYDRAWRNRR